MLRLAPDGDVKQPGNLQTISNLVPTNRGTYRTAYAKGDSAYAALSGVCVGAAFITKPDATVRLFAGTNQFVYEANQGTGTTWTDRSSATYSGVSSVGWMFGQFGENTIKVNKNITTEVSTTAAFSTLSGSPPKAQIVVTQSNAVWLFNINDGTDKPDAYRISDQGVHTTWTPAASNEAFEGRLYDTDGPITAAIPFQNGVVAFKRRGMWFIEYVGRPDIYVARMISSEHGCVGPRALTVAEGVIYFYSDRGVYVYDGTYPKLISDEIRSLVFAGGVFGPDLLTSIIAVHDEANSLIKFYRFLSGSTYSGWLSYNYKAGSWGMNDSVDSGQAIEMAFQTTVAQMYAFAGVSGAVPAAATGWTSDFAFNQDHKLVNFNSATVGASSFRTWFTGRQDELTQITRAFFIFNDAPVTTSVSGTLAGYRHAKVDGSAQFKSVNWSQLDANDSASVNAVGRWLQLLFSADSTSGFYEISDVYFDPPPVGKRAGKS